jgi:hypothetical protein
MELHLENAILATHADHAVLVGVVIKAAHVAIPCCDCSFNLGAGLAYQLAPAHFLALEQGGELGA